jgi:hypothetical protein
MKLGIEPEERVPLPKHSLQFVWLQNTIHQHHPISRYDVERLGGIFTAEMTESRDED